MRAQPASDIGDPPTGAQLGKYQLLATLGQGGMGTVHLALASGLGQFRKLLVVKELRQDLTRQPGFVDMFMDEAKLAARLAHPNVVQTFEASAVDDRYLLAMEYLDGYPLSALLERLSRLPVSKLTLWMHLQVLCDVLAGLHYAHELLDYDGTSLQVVHRDVSPQNVFITYHGQVKVVDFGVAKAANATVKTAPGTFVGKFSYASPEQVLGSGVDARTDVFAVGVMLWEAIAHRSFSEREPTPNACRSRVEGLEPRIADIVPTVDPVLARICDRALSVDVDERFASAKEFRYALQNYMQMAGVRVETAEIGLLMQEVFASERRALHTRIEEAVRANGMSDSAVDELPIFHTSEKVPTAVADLSSLVEVSLEQDEQKLQKSYAHSKVTLVRSNGKRETVLASPASSYKARSPLLAFLGLSALVGVSLAILTRSETPKAKLDSHDSFATESFATNEPKPKPVVSAAPTAPASTKADDGSPAPNASAGPRARADRAAGTALPAGVGSPSSQPDPQPTAHPRATRAAANRPEEPSEVQVASAREPSPTSTLKSRTPSGSSRGAPTETPARDSTRAKTAASVGNAKSVEEGTDLTFGRRLPLVRIDSENPYQ